MQGLYHPRDFCTYPMSCQTKKMPHRRRPRPAGLVCLYIFSLRQYYKKLIVGTRGPSSRRSASRGMKMQPGIAKAQILIESLPYIKKFYNKTVVIKWV